MQIKDVSVRPQFLNAVLLFCACGYAELWPLPDIFIPINKNRVLYKITTRYNFENLLHTMTSCYTDSSKHEIIPEIKLYLRLPDHNIVFQAEVRVIK